MVPMKVRQPALMVAAALCLLLGCSSGQPEAVNRNTELPPVTAPAPQPSEAKSNDGRPVVVVFGDSLSAGHGLLPGEAFPDHLQKLLDQDGLRFRIVNQGISGDTTSGGLARVDQALALNPKVVLLELGGNDGLRGIPPKAIYENLDQMIGKFTTGGAQVVLLGMSLPRNYGDDYVRQFEKNYSDLARKHSVQLVPFLLKGIWNETGATPGMVQDDGIHPTAKGTPVMAETVFGTLKKVLEKAR